MTSHGSAESFKAGCRCDDCTAAVPHGVRKTYVHQRCRCAACRYATSDYLSGRYSQLRSGERTLAQHGLASYAQGCPCDVCRAAATEAMREYRAGKQPES